jgi:putative Holliday junction resolvase
LKILGIDHGNVRIGIAISDESGSFARPLTIITHVSRAKDAEEICRLGEEEGCGMIVVGIPYDSDGSEGPRARSVLRFADQLKSVCRVPVMTWDESFSTQSVISTSVQMNKSRISRKQALDDKAAALILQSFLDHCAQTPEDKSA